MNHASADEMTAAICKELELRSDYLPEKKPLQTIYFGGGTPSVLSITQLERIFRTIYGNYVVATDAEITMEANPDDLTKSKLIELRSMPLNRLSIGVQSFSDRDLLLMNRSHSAAAAEQSVLAAAEAGFNNITIDLMYGIPGSGMENWSENLHKAFNLPVQHLSCYGLTIEKRTHLSQMVLKGEVNIEPDENYLEQFSELMDQAADAGFEHYEISNFARPGFRSKHNSRYWKDLPYLGVGPSAHSYDGVSRQWNVASNTAYMQSLAKGSVPAEIENLTVANRYNEYVMTRLRTMEGADLNMVRQKFGDSYANHFLKEIRCHVDSGSVKVDERNYSLTRSGQFIADRIASDVFYMDGDA